MYKCMNIYIYIYIGREIDRETWKPQKETLKTEGDIITFSAHND